MKKSSTVITSYSIHYTKLYDEITITSVSRSPLQLTYINLEGIGHYFDLSGVADGDNEENFITLKPFEQITLDVNFTVDTWLSNIYKSGGEFFVDTRPVVYYIDDWETYEYELKEEGESAPVKIANLSVITSYSIHYTKLYD